MEREEYYKNASTDVIFFAENFFRLSYMSSPIVLTNEQKEMLLDFQNRNSCIIDTLKPCGITLITCIFSLWYALFHENKVVFMVSPKEYTISENFEIIKNAYESIPEWLKPPLVICNKGKIVFEGTGSVIVFSRTTSNVCRGISVSLLVSDDFSYGEKTMMNDFFMSIYPPVYASNAFQIHINSSSKRNDIFREYFKKAIDGQLLLTPVLFVPSDSDKS